MSASSWIGIGFLVFSIILLIIALVLAVYSERRFSGVNSWPLYRGFATIGGKDVVLSCPVGRKISLQRAVYGPFGSGNGCDNCIDVDALDSLKSQVDGKETATISSVPTDGVWGTTRSCPAGSNCASGYALSGNYSCVV